MKPHFRSASIGVRPRPLASVASGRRRTRADADGRRRTRADAGGRVRGRRWVRRWRARTFGAVDMVFVESHPLRLAHWACCHGTRCALLSPLPLAMPRWLMVKPCAARRRWLRLRCVSGAARGHLACAWPLKVPFDTLMHFVSSGTSGRHYPCWQQSRRHCMYGHAASALVSVTFGRMLATVCWCCASH